MYTVYPIVIVDNKYWYYIMPICQHWRLVVTRTRVRMYEQCVECPRSCIQYILHLMCRACPRHEVQKTAAQLTIKDIAAPAWVTNSSAVMVNLVLNIQTYNIAHFFATIGSQMDANDCPRWSVGGNVMSCRKLLLSAVLLMMIASGKSEGKDRPRGHLL